MKMTRCVFPGCKHIAVGSPVCIEHTGVPVPTELIEANDGVAVKRQEPMKDGDHFLKKDTGSFKEAMELVELSNQNHQASLDQRKDEAALRYDKGKPRYDLLPADSLEELVWVYTKGAEKYADRNWEKGMSYSRCFGSMMRHSWAWWKGEISDKETGCHHLAHVAWNALALVSYQMREVGIDDRPKTNS